MYQIDYDIHRAITSGTVRLSREVDHRHLAAAIQNRIQHEVRGVRKHVAEHLRGAGTDLEDIAGVAGAGLDALQLSRGQCGADGLDDDAGGRGRCHARRWT